MPRKAAKLIALAAALATTGCGTMGNLKRDDRIYGGVAIDAAPVGQACKDLTRSENEREFTFLQDCAILRYGFLDLPFSAILDTLTLPITVSHTLFPRPPKDPATHPHFASASDAPATTIVESLPTSAESPTP
jgi:uncharacterized protein YceK